VHHPQDGGHFPVGDFFICADQNGDVRVGLGFRLQIRGEQLRGGRDIVKEELAFCIESNGEGVGLIQLTGLRLRLRAVRRATVDSYS